MRASTRKSTLVARQFRVGLCLTLGLAGFAALAPAQGAGAVSGTVTLFDSSTTGTGFFASAATVPASVCFVTITADGGHGGNLVDEFTGAVGGVAASVTARVGVTPGDGLAAEVAGAGGDVEKNGRSSAGGGPGGVGGGGGGGGVNADGAGGGGASAVSSSSAGSLVVAGGGGGAANLRAGGAGGLPDGGNGSGNLPGLGGLASGVGGAGAPAGGGVNPQGGGGGVSTGGVAGSLPSGGNGTGVNAVPSVGGGGGGAVGNSTVTSAPGGNGGSSDTGQGGPAGAFGGAGGAGNTNGGNGGVGASGGGSGGAGGIGFGGGGGGSATGGGGGFGGGGGGGNNSGGGGGSSHVISTATSSAFAASTRAGDGQVTITYDPTADMCPPTPINVTVSGSQGYGNTPNTFTRTDNGPVGVLSGTVSCTTVNGTPISPTLPVGLYRIDGASCSGLSASGNYSVTYTGGDFAVTKAGQGIHFPKSLDLPYGTKTTTLSATVTSNLSVEFTSSTTPVCTVAGNALTVVKAGTCTVVAGQSGDANHNPADPVTQSFVVGGFMGDRVIEAPEQCDDGNTVAGDGCSVTGVIEPSQQAQSITFAAPANKLYGVTPFNVAATATSGLPMSFTSSTTTVCTVSGATVTIKSAGLCTIRATQTGNGSWLAAPPVDRSFTVGYGIASLFPPGSTKFDRGAPIPVVFALTGANGKAIPAAVASSLGCTVKVTFNGGSPICATWVPILNVFGAIINTPKTLIKGQSYPIVVTVAVGSTTVATATTTIIAK